MNEALEGYKDYLNRRYSEGSRMASSCLYVIERIGKILNHVPAYAYIPDDFTKIKNLELLHTLYEYVKDEQKKNGGIFNGSTLSKGYWGKSFCSSVIKNYMDYLIETYDGVLSTGESHITQHIQEPMQKITYGAPGTGKSHKTKLETEAWKKNVFRTTFHPDSDYSTFVGAYKPTMKESQRINCVGDKAMEVKFDGGAPLMQEEITYDFVAQAFVKAYVLAWRKMAGAGDENGKPKPEPVFLVIEEINRGNCAQIFGDLFQLLDRNDAGYSEYPIDADADLRNFLAKKGEERLGDIDANALSTRYGIEADLAKAIVAGEKLVLPTNFLIRATMNTSDQSLFPIDSAFKRRWDWEYVPILEGVDEKTKQPLGWKIAFDVPKLDANGQPVMDADGNPEFEAYEKEWWDFVLKVNEIIGSATHSEDKKLGYFFVKAEKKDDKLIVSDKKILEKVIFYLWNDVFKDIGLGKIFADKDGGGVEFHRFFDARTGAIDSVLVKEFVEHVLNAKPE